MNLAEPVVKFDLLLTIILGSSTAVLLAGDMGQISPFLDLFSLLSVGSSGLNLASAALLMLRRRRRWEHRVLICGCMVPAILALRPDGQQGHCASLGPHLRMAWLNVRRSDRPDPILDWIEREQPQIAGFAELDKGSVDLRGQLVRRFPHWRSCLANGRCSTVLYARTLPIDTSSLAHGDPENRKALSAVRMVLPLGGSEDVVPVTAVHLSRPLPLGRQRTELAALKRTLSGSPREVVIGDLNMSPRMKGLGAFAAEAGLRINLTHRPTWPASLIGLWQIDHVLTGRGWTVTDIRTSPDLGSDHRGIVIDLCANSHFE